MTIKNKTAVVIGGGPAGLMAAEVLAEAGVKVDLYDSMPSAGLKFLRAGKGGLNITHSGSLDVFLSRYGRGRHFIEPYLRSFGPEQLRSWIHDLGIKTFTGSSGRVFPADMKARPLLRLWLERLASSGVSFHMRHSWCGWDEEGRLKFKTDRDFIYVNYCVVIFALGGGSWKHLGSDGAWVDLFEKMGIPVSLLKPSNCGFEAGWSDYFRTRFEGQVIKPVSVSIISPDGRSCSKKPGEIVITSTGIEGGVVYFISSFLRDMIENEGFAVVHLDLAPGRTASNLEGSLAKPRGSASMSNHIRKCTGLEGVKAGLLRELLPKDEFSNPARLAGAIKSLPLKLSATGSMDRAISTAGGVCFEALDANLMIKTIPGMFCAGEMLDWDAPTGGYLLTACFSTGMAAGSGAVKWIEAIR